MEAYNQTQDHFLVNNHNSNKVVVVVVSSVASVNHNNKLGLDSSVNNNRLPNQRGYLVVCRHNQPPLPWEVLEVCSEVEATLGSFHSPNHKPKAYSEHHLKLEALDRHHLSRVIRASLVTNPPSAKEVDCSEVVVVPKAVCKAKHPHNQDSSNNRRPAPLEP